jgi:uncharacterized SAM-binding protein YcdF (DUF218 family)
MRSTLFASNYVKIRFVGAVLVATVVLIVILFHTQILAGLGSYLVESDQPSKADTVLVLDGDSTGRRILTAAQLVRDGYAPQVLVSGIDGTYGFFTCDLAIPFAVKHGYPESYFVHLESQARSTVEEAHVTIDRIRKLGYHKVLLVTSNYHTHRAARIYRSQAPDLTFIVVAAPDANFTPDGWWHNREGEKTFVYEWEKTVANWFGI